MIKNKQNKQEKPDINLEYTTCLDLLKHSSNVEIAMFSFFSVLMSGFAYFLFGKEKPDEPILSILKTVAFLFSLGLWISGESNAYLVSKFFCRAREIEEEIGLKVISSLPKIKPYWKGPTNWSLRILYFLVSFFWFLSIFLGVF